MDALPPSPPALEFQVQGPVSGCTGTVRDPVVLPKTETRKRRLAHGGIILRCVGGVERVRAVVCIEMKYPRGWVPLDCRTRRLGAWPPGSYPAHRPPPEPLVIGKAYRTMVTYPCGLSALFGFTHQWRISFDVRAWDAKGRTAVHRGKGDIVSLNC